MTIWRMRITCWITRTTNTHSEYVTLVAFPLQQWLRERTSMLLYMHMACVDIIFKKPRPALGPPSLLSNGYRGSFPGIKQLEHEADHSPLSGLLPSSI